MLKPRDIQYFYTLVYAHPRGYESKVPDAESALWLQVRLFFYHETLFTFNKLVLLLLQQARRQQILDFNFVHE